MNVKDQTKMRDTSRYSLVYQRGLANVFDGNGRRVLQHCYRTCEVFCYGLVHAGIGVDTFHCDIAGDCFGSHAVWNAGPGEMWAEQKHPPVSDIPMTEVKR